MVTSTNTKDAESQKLYDEMMEKILPELRSTEIPHLMEKYKNETKEERLQRARRYGEAFEEFERQFHRMESAMVIQTRTFKRDALRSTEKREREQEQSSLSILETQIQNA